MKLELPDGYHIHQIALSNGFTYRVGNAGLHNIQYADDGYICYGHHGMLILVAESEVCAVEMRTSIRDGVPATEGSETNANPRTVRKNRRDTTKQEQLELDVDIDNRGNK